MQHTTRIPRRLVTATVVAALLGLGLAVPSLGSAQAAPTAAEDGSRGRAGLAIAHHDTASGARTGPVSPPAAAPLGTRRTAAGDGAPSPSAVGAAGLASRTCDSGFVQVTMLSDRIVVRAQMDGAASIRLERQRNQGTWRTVGTLAGALVTFKDTANNPLGSSSYRLSARNSAGTVVDQCDLYGVYSTSTNDGWGAPDFVVAGESPLTQQVPGVSPSVPVSGGAWLTPAYSTDGRLVAATRIDDTTGAGILEVRLARTFALQFSVDLGADTSVADPAFSPDGQTLAFSGYDTASGQPLGIGFVPVRGTHTPRLLDTDVPVAEPAWMPDSSSLVVTAFDAANGLSKVCSTCTHPVPLSGTQGGFTPEVARDGTLYFTVQSATTSALLRRSPAGAVSTLRTSTTEVFSQPRLAPDGRLFVERATRPTTSSQHEIVEVAAGGPQGDYATDTRLYGDIAVGYAVRQPKSKGTSDYVGDANNEVLARDSSGRLWAYPSLTQGKGTRSSMGAGWNMFNQVVAAGDLDGDDHADILGRKPDGTLWLYHGLGNAKVRAGTQVGSGWSSYVIVAPGDFNGDGIADLLGRDSRYQLWLYPGKGDGHFGARSLVTSGWGGFSAIIGIGDFNFDGKADILGRERSTGYLYLYPGTGTGAITGRTRVGAGWNTINAFAATEFRGSNPGLFGRRADGTLRYYDVVGDGRIDSWRAAGTGWGGMLITG